MHKKLLIIIELSVLVFFLYWHFKLGLVRFFDADEFAHLHWGYSFSIGERPYTDFFYLFPPFFLYPVAALFKIFGRSAQVLIYARVFIFLVFAATSAILFLLAKKLRGVHFALLTVIIFAFLPLPFDKMIEVRPDLLATGLALLGMYLFIKGYEGDGPSFAKASAGKRKYFFLSGLSYAVSLGFVPKTVFFLVPAVIVLSYLGYLSYLRGERKKETAWLYFFPGMLPVGLVLLGIIWSSGNLPLAVYSMSRMASEVTKVLGAKFYMLPNIFFYPNDTYYGYGGVSWPLIVNLIIYVSASVWGILKLISSLSHSDTKKCVAQFLVAGSFFANLAAFVYFYPLKHAQYLIPVAPFIAFYFADMLSVILRSDSDEGSSTKVRFARFFPLDKLGVRMTTFFVIILLITIIGFGMNQKKEKWVNKPTLDKVANFLQILPSDAAVYDLTGESIFFRNGYYFCCLPYGQYEEALYLKIPDIETDMQKRGTRYVHLGWDTRLKEIPTRHAKYIMENFVPLPLNGSVLVRKI